MGETVTILVWEGEQYESYETLEEREPEEYEVLLASTDHGEPWEVGTNERVMLSESIDHHGTYMIGVPDSETPATVNIHTNDSYHDPEDWGPAIERGMTWPEENDYDPFRCEMWGRIMMWVERPE